MKRVLLLSSLSALTIAACDTTPRWRDAQYWQRVDATSALYLQGPKAQQTLHQDISRCVSDVNELQRLGSIKKAVPADLEKPDQKEMSRWDTPKKDGYRYSEHLDYTGFETCMHAKGWERVEHLPYDVSTRARDNWIDTIAQGDEKQKQKMYGQDDTIRKEARPPDSDRHPYDDLNN